ncbi:cupin domain-containing protein [Fictibacillus nanhaiensis]|uniref:sugar phosphate nucleotidyltransferase n=1 Tax=Fictibacillus nanhaiensis TaxID=742169 RepID=UPI001C9881DA|nr:sugar phosphate nucleotidyltransferase [Fictibacillus nanhaiensis]MBY6037226.1 cupin domain-containing protein [Fictibacillus nanhaiensis]
MKVVLLSGGSGKRLWPLSNDARSKQFLKVLKNENKESVSMTQRVWNQLSSVNLDQSTVIATSSAQVDMIKSQICGMDRMVVEPERRDTFPAIALAASYLYSVMKTNPEEVVIILPVDSYVETAFFEKVKELEAVLHQSDAQLALLGVKPTYPSEKYGYIVPDSKNDHNWMTVSHFKEKPDGVVAEELIHKNSLWNCGVFAFKLEYMLSLLENRKLPLHYEELRQDYSALPRTSFDYEVAENENHIVALQYEGYWKDLGTWNTLSDEMETEKLGKGLLFDCTNTHLINELNIPITVIGGANLMIAASPDGILVSDKEKSHLIKNILAGHSHRPMYEERRWGWYKVLDYTKVNENHEVLTKRLAITSGNNLSYQLHSYRCEVWTIIKGEGEFVCEGEIRQVKAGDVLEIPVKTRHAIRAITDLEVIEVQSGSQLIEEDIERIYLHWNDIERHCHSVKSPVEV